MDEPRDFFISYTAADRAWAEWIAWQLEAEGYTTVLQAWDFTPGDNFVVRMRDALDHADRTIAVLSPAYLTSEYGTDEWASAFLHDATGQQRLLPVLVETCELPRLLAALVYIDLAGLTREQARARLLAGVRRGRRRPQREPGFPGDAGPAAAGEPTFPGRQPKVSNLPARNLVFTGRDSQLTALQQRLTTATPAVVSQPQALHGLGGVGKTQLALEYAHRHGGDYDLIWWMGAEQPAAIPGQLVALARRLGIPEAVDQAETIAVLFDELRIRDRWLLVFDNAEDPRHLRAFWPPGGGGQVLVTSRNPAWGGLATPVPLDVLPRAESVGFLRRRLGDDDPAFARLAEVLGDLPLALEQAAAYLEETAIGVSDYLDLLGERAQELFALGQPTSEQTIATIWTLALQRLREQTPAAEDLLVLCAYLAPDDIPRSLLAQHPGVLPQRLAATIQDRLAYQQAVAALRRYSLVKASGDALSVHRLVQAVVRQRLDDQTRQVWAASATRLLCAAFPGRPEKVTAWPVAGRLLPHALAVTDQPDSHNAEPETTAILLSRAARYLWGRAEHPTAMRLLERAVAVCQAWLPADDPTTAQSLTTLGLVLRDQGDLDRARTHLERALSIHKARFGPDHPSTAWGLNFVANVLRAQGDLDGARALHERALAIFEARLGADDLATANSLENLAGVLYDQGDLDDARTRLERVLAIREAGLGPDDPDTAWSLDNLALVRRAQGDLDDARTLLKRAVAIREARLGPDHPTTATSLSNLAGVLHARGDLQHARTLHERALAIRKARLGPDHPETARSLHNLARVLAEQGDLAGARTLHERALHIRETRLGAEHPDTQRSRGDLAAVVSALENRS
jgi:tetratricopeptide (TPR) repeat protein